MDKKVTMLQIYRNSEFMSNIFVDMHLEKQAQDVLK